MKRCIMIIPFLSVAFGAAAQDFYAGVYGGLLKNATETTNDFALPVFVSRQKLTTINYGIHLGYQLSDHWGIETQLQYANISNKKGFLMDNISPPGPGGVMYMDVMWYNKYHYIKVPLLAHYQFFSSKSRFGLGLLAGPNLGLFMQQSSRFRSPDDVNPDLWHSPSFTGPEVKKIDLGAQVGLRARARLHKSIYLYGEGSVYQGFSNVAQDKQPLALHDGARIVNRYFTLDFGIQYHLSRK